MRYSPAKILVITGLLSLVFITSYGQIRFEDVTQRAGLIEPLKGMMGHCAAWGDVNDDGFPDLFIGTFTHKPDSTYNVRGHKGVLNPINFS